MNRVILFALALLACNSATLVAQNVIDLSGTWRFQLDPDNIGSKDEWFLNDELNETVQLPGTTDTNQKGYKTKPWPADSITRNFVFPRDFGSPEWIYELNTAPTRKYKYIGAAWYQKEVVVPRSWQGKRVELFLERSLFKMVVWVDEQKVGEDVSLYAPRSFDITDYIKPGKKHRITLCIDNTNLIGGMAHGYTYHTQTNWNGVVGQMELRSTDQVHMTSTRVFTEIEDQAVRVETKVANHIGRTKGCFRLVIKDKGGKVVATKTTTRNIEYGGSLQEFYLTVEQPVTWWDEYSPELYTLSVEMSDVQNDLFHEQIDTHFGFRKISTSGTTVLVNNRPVFFRGTLDCAIYPKTGFMPMNQSEWRRILSTIKSYGMNHVRFHSVCPPKAAFEVADALGIYLQAELIWGPEPTPDEYVLEYLYNDGFRILKEYGNHPSFAFMALGNELSHADNVHKNRVIDAYRGFDSRRLYSTQAGHVKKKHRSSAIRYDKNWENGESCNIPRERLIKNNNFDFSAGKSTDEPPLIIHENGQWVMYPGFAFMQKYDGVKRPDNFYPLYERLVENGLADQDEAMAEASGKHGIWHTKQVFESLFRTEGVAGFQFLGLQDFPGQSEAMVGILDPFWDSKGYITTDKFKQFCNDVVPLLRMDKWVYTNDESFEAKASVFNYGQKILKDKTVTWRLINENGALIKNGQFNKVNAEQGAVTNIGLIRLELDVCKQPGQYVLQLAIEETSYENEWDFYVYPSSGERPVEDGIYITHRIDAKAQQLLNDGGKVLLLWPTADYGNTVQKISYTPQYWSFNRGALGRVYPGTAGLLCNPEHPLFKYFPTQSHADARWMDLVDGANAFVINDFKGLKPVVQIIDDYHRNNKLAAVFEARIGKGRLLACAFDLERELEERPVAQQLRNAIVEYMNSKRFCPDQKVDMGALRNLLRDPKTQNRVVEGSSRWPLHDYKDMLDGDPDTFWSSEWNGEWRASHSHYVVIELGQERQLSGLTYTPRQDSENGRVADYEVYLSSDGKNWGKPIVKGQFTNSAAIQKVFFKKSPDVRFVKFVSLKEVNNRKWAAIGDLSFF
ncbi:MULTISPECIES: discoidin domain-containing protein [unclassified Carboxylicivirga]|uniref:discoidin domain-containing protein n=1 Tax=Carboxylicivirga TaxID=1628153 RepID=UPI003D341CD6